MGGGRDKRKKAKPKQPGVGAEKTARKTQKNDTKAEQRALKKAQVLLDQESLRRTSACAVVANAHGDIWVLITRVEPCVQGGDDDIDALLAAIKVQDVKKVVIHEDCDPPSARSCACLVPHTTKVRPWQHYHVKLVANADEKSFQRTVCWTRCD